MKIKLRQHRSIQVRGLCGCIFRQIGQIISLHTGVWKLIAFIIPIIIMLFLSSCAQVIVSTTDEIRLNSWSVSLQNGSMVRLDFESDSAELCVKSKDSDARTRIKGLCFFDSKSMLIYDRAEREPYIFEYQLKNNKLILKYSGGRLVLTREN